MTRLAFSAEDQQALHKERFEHPHPRVSRRSRLLTTPLSSSDRAILETCCAILETWEDLVSRACCRFSVFFRLTSPGRLRTLKTRFLICQR